jgi:hypothetical protein
MPDPAWREMSDKAYATASQYSWQDATDLFEAALLRAAERSRHGDLRGVSGTTASTVPPAAAAATAHPTTA